MWVRPTNSDRLVSCRLRWCNASSRRQCIKTYCDVAAAGRVEPQRRAPDGAIAVAGRVIF